MHFYEELLGSFASPGPGEIALAMAALVALRGAMLLLRRDPPPEPRP